VVGKHLQNMPVSPLVHTSRLDRHRTVRTPFEPSAQLFDTTRRAIPPVAHGRLIGDARAFAAPEKPDAVMVIPSIEDPRRAVAFAAREHEVSPAIVNFPPVAENVLRYRV
jgi:hypothetical protein